MGPAELLGAGLPDCLGVQVGWGAGWVWKGPHLEDVTFQKEEASVQAGG